MGIDYIIDWVYATANQYGNETVTLDGEKKLIRTVCLDVAEVLLAVAELERGGVV